MLPSDSHIPLRPLFRVRLLLLSQHRIDMFGLARRHWRHQGLRPISYSLVATVAQLRGIRVPSRCRAFNLIAGSRFPWKHILITPAGMPSRPESSDSERPQQQTYTTNTDTRPCDLSPLTSSLSRPLQLKEVQRSPSNLDEVSCSVH